MTKTRTDLIYRSLRNLGALPQGQQPNAEEFQSIKDLTDSVFAGLERRNVVVISTTTFNDEYLIPLGHIVALAASEEFGFHNDQGLAAYGQKGEADLMQMQRGKVLS